MGTKLTSDEKYLRATFKEFDKNGDGTISKEELMVIFKNDGNNMTK